MVGSTRFDLGIVGLFLVALLVLLVLTRAIAAVVTGRDPEAQYLVVMSFMLLTNNVTESNLMRPGFFWTFLVMASVALARIARERRVERDQRLRRGRAEAWSLAHAKHGGAMS